MATTALGVVSLADAKRELRVSGSDDDALITSHIEAAVAYVSDSTGRPLIRATETFRTYPPVDREAPVRITLADVQTFTKVELWGPDRKPNQTADVVVTSFGRTQKSRYGYHWEIYPADEWPDYRVDQYALVTATVEVTSIPADLKQAVLLAVGHLFDGMDLGESGSLATLLRAHRRTDLPE